MSIKFVHVGSKPKYLVGKIVGLKILIILFHLNKKKVFN